MTVPYVVCAYHTTDPLYMEQIERLTASLCHHQLPFFIRSIAPTTWLTAVTMKAKFVQEMLARHPSSDVLYLDADAAVLSYPTLFDAYPHDIGVFLRPGQDLQSATIYVKNNPSGRLIVDRWVQLQEQMPKAWDQRVLQKVIDAYKAMVDVGALPVEYCRKFDMAVRDGEGPTVIEQYQASRRVSSRS